MDKILLLLSQDVIASVWIKKNLKEHFYIIHEKEAQKALGKFLTNKIDLVILDEGIPDPLHFAKTIRQSSHPWTPILLITGNLRHAFRKEAIQAGITDFLSEPLELEELNTRIDVCFALQELHEKVSHTFEKKAEEASVLLSRKGELQRFAIEEVSRAKKEKTPLVMALIRIDDFKELEKKWGVLEMNRFLLSISKILSQEMGKKELLIPETDGKFVLLFPDFTLSSAKEKTDSLMSRVKKQLASKKIEFKASIGFTSHAPGKDSSEKSFMRMIERAEKTIKKNRALSKKKKL